MISRSEIHSNANDILESEDPISELMDDLAEIGLDHDIEIATIAFLGCISRRFGNGQWILFTGESGSGKSHLRSVIRDCVPVEECLSFEYASDKALLYHAKNSDEPLELDQYVLIGDERQSGKPDHPYLRTLYSEKRIDYSVATARGTETLRIKGRPAMLETTTASGIDIEDQNRRLVLPVNETREKKEQVVEYKNMEAANLLELDRDEITATYQELQRLLPKLDRIEIPFAQGIKPKTSSLGAISRAHDQLLVMTKAAGLMRFKKRRIFGDTLICKMEDYELAHGLMSPLHNSIVSGVDDQERELIRSIGREVKKLPLSSLKKKRFTVADIGTWAGLGRGTRERRIKKAVESGLLVESGGGGRGSQRYYELGDVQGILTKNELFPSGAELKAN